MQLPRNIRDPLLYALALVIAYVGIQQFPDSMRNIVLGLGLIALAVVLVEKARE